MAYTNIKKPSDYFNTKLYTGTGSSQGITGVGFQPDFTWIKKRNGAVGHRLYDAVRGATNTLYSDDSAAEATGQTNTLTSFNSDGFTVVSETGVNASSDTYAAWNWKANGAGSANTQGDIASTVSASATSGFSIVSWTSLASGSNYTVGHGLGSTPAMIIMKGRHESNSWIVYHHKNTSAPETDYLELNSTEPTADSLVWNDTAPTSSVFTCGTWSGFDNGGTMIAYCFAEVQGYSKFGSYTGNGNADGTFVYTGFKPAFVLIKQTNAVGAWYMWDNKRDTINPYQKFLIPNGTNVEYSGSERWLDSLSNGFKWRNTETAMNGSGASYIYMAFAEEPLVGDNPATAR